MADLRVRVGVLEGALREFEEAVSPKLLTMNYYFGPGARTAVSPQSVAAWRRIKAACERARAVLAGGEAALRCDECGKESSAAKYGDGCGSEGSECKGSFVAGGEAAGQGEES